MAAFIEFAYAGVHRERRGRQRGKSPINGESMRRMFAGFGAVVPVVGKYVPPIDIHLVPPHGLKKAQRHSSLETACRRVGVKLPRNKDIRDAIGLAPRRTGASIGPPASRRGLRHDRASQVPHRA